MRRRDIRVGRARVIVDCIKNDVRGTRLQGRVERGEVVERLRSVIGEMGGSEGIVVCEVKPMQHIDVVPFNARIHDLCLYTEGVEGCSTQVRHDYLRRYGYHITPKHGRLLDMLYECAMVGWLVPCPYWDSVVYDMLAKWAKREWPPLGGRGANNGQKVQGQGVRLRSYGKQ